MSFADFNDMMHMCCDMTEEEECLVEKVRIELLTDRSPEENPWWEMALKEIEKERELLHV